MIAFLIPLLVGTATGVLSGMGVGGGTLLLIYMTGWGGLSQIQAQGVNLLYFLPAALAALPQHIKNRFVDWHVAIPAICAGLVGTALAAWIATALDVTILRRCFGVFLLYIGCSELFRKNPK